MGSTSPPSPPERRTPDHGAQGQPLARDFGTALRRAIQRNGLSLYEISRRLREENTPVSTSALSYWQKGENQPERGDSLAAVANLEKMLGESPGGLVSLIGPRRARGRWWPRDIVRLRHDDFWDHAESVTRVLAKVDASPDDLTFPHKISQSLSYKIDEHGYEQSVRVRRLIRADTDGTRRIVFVTRCETLPQPPVVTHTEGCRPARFRADVSSSTCAFEFALDRVLRAGELAMIEFGLRYPPGQTDTFVRLQVARVSRELSLQVSFDPRRLPASCYGYYHRRNTLPKQRVQEVAIARPPHAIQFITLDPRPGTYGISWEWPHE